MVSYSYVRIYDICDIDKLTEMGPEFNKIDLDFGLLGNVEINAYISKDDDKYYLVTSADYITVENSEGGYITDRTKITHCPVCGRRLSDE